MVTLEKALDYLLAVITGGLLTVALGLYRARAQNRTDQSVSDLNQATAWKTLLIQMQDRVLDQQKELDGLELEIAERDGYIHKVLAILHQHHIEAPTYVFRRRYENLDKPSAKP